MAARRVADRQALRRGRPDGPGACRAGCQAGSRLCGRATCASLRIAGRRETSKRPTARSRHFTARLPAPAPHGAPSRTDVLASRRRPSSLARPPRLTSSVRSTTRPSGAGAAASPRSSSSALRQAPLCLPLPRLTGSVRQHRRPLGGGMNSARREANGMTAGARKTPGARQAPPGRQAPRQSPSRCANRSGQTRRARNGGSAPRPLPLTTGNFPSAAPGPRPVARAPDSRCGRPVHRVRWPAPGRRYPAHCG